jgi:Spy/CpxP family protein refolding chaperone
MKPASRKWMWASLVLTLIVGMGMGVAIDRLVLEREGRDGARGERVSGLAARLRDELQLTPEQQAKVEAALAANRERARQFWRESQTAYENLRTEFRQQIRALLDPEQQTRFDEMVQRADERRRRREERP